MTDKELLGMAAKAIGEEFDGWALKSRGSRPWNPLVNDGDCFRLETELKIGSMWFEPTGEWITAKGQVARRHADRKRSVVLLAAELGKLIP